MIKSFLAFPGYQVQIPDKILKVGELEFWNLEKISDTEFLKLIQKKIKIFKGHVEISYTEQYKRSYKESSWGLLIPDYSDYPSGSINQILFVMNIFSGTSLPITFTVQSLGLTVEQTNVPNNEKSGFHTEDIKFSNKNFLKFYKLIMPEVIETIWQANKVLNRDKEQWRFYVAILSFENLDKYQKSKKIMTRQRECAEMVALYETLLSRRKNDNGSYKIIQRIEILLSKYYKDDFEQIKKNLKKLFDYRNEFVHGSFFEHLQKDTKPYSDDINMAQLPNVDFKFLQEQTEILRKVFIIFTYLKIKFKNNKNKLSVPEIINLGIMDISIRKKIEKYSKEILALAYFKK